MSAASLLVGLCGLAAVWWPFSGKYVAVGLGLFALLVGLRAGRRARATGAARPRLTAAAGVTAGCVALLLGGAKIVLTLLAIDRLGGLLGP
jgi:hypothetical protein